VEEKILDRLMQLALIVVSLRSLLVHGCHKEVRLRIFGVAGNHLLAAFRCQVELAKHVLFQCFLVEGILCAGIP